MLFMVLNKEHTQFDSLSSNLNLCAKLNYNGNVIAYILINFLDEPVMVFQRSSFFSVADEKKVYA